MIRKSRTASDNSGTATSRTRTWCSSPSAARSGRRGPGNGKENLNLHERDAIRVCRLEDIVPNTGVCALVRGRQIAIFRLDDDSVYALDNRDPFSGASVLSRGIVGDLKGELVVASPVYKQHFSLLTGRCIEDAGARIPVYEARIEEGWVVVEPRKQVATTCCYCGVVCSRVVLRHKHCNVS